MEPRLPLAPSVEPLSFDPDGDPGPGDAASAGPSHGPGFAAPSSSIPQPQPSMSQTDGAVGSSTGASTSVEMNLLNQVLSAVTGIQECLDSTNRTTKKLTERLDTLSQRIETSGDSEYSSRDQASREELLDRNELHLPSATPQGTPVPATRDSVPMRSTPPFTSRDSTTPMPDRTLRRTGVEQVRFSAEAPEVHADMSAEEARVVRSLMLRAVKPRSWKEDINTFFNRRCDELTMWYGRPYASNLESEQEYTRRTDIYGRIMSVLPQIEETERATERPGATYYDSPPRGALQPSPDDEPRADIPPHLRRAYEMSYPTSATRSTLPL